MGLFRRRRNDEPAATSAALADFPEGSEALLAEIERLTAAERDRDTERRILQLRHRAGIRLMQEADGAPQYPAPAADRLPEARLPEIDAADVTPELLRAGILRDGCLLVRGLVDRDEALRFAGQIDRAFAAREEAQAGGTPPEGYYEELEPEPGFAVASVRPWIQEGGGVLAADSPLLSFEMLEMFRAAGVQRLAGEYLGEAPLISVHKTTLRKADPSVGGSWHQDGAFMGRVRALNLWLSLSRCGDEAPGLDLVPRRLDRVVIEQDAMLDAALTQQRAEAAAGDVQIVRPIFEPGDALFFDELFLHSTASDPSMPNPRFAIESWFFGASAFPSDYAPIAVV
jgi:hypothetical protein